MKKIPFVLAAVACAFFATAQKSSFGLKAGANVYKISGEDFGDVSSTKVGIHGGAFYRIPVAMLLSFQPEVLYSSEGMELKKDDVSATFSLHYLNIPLLLQLATPGGFIMEMGPQVGFLLNSKVKYEEAGVKSEERLDSLMNKASFSWGAGAGYFFSNVGLGVRYNVGISRLPKDADGGNSKSNGLQASLIWRLRK